MSTQASTSTSASGAAHAPGDGLRALGHFLRQRAKTGQDENGGREAGLSALFTFGVRIVSAAITFLVQVLMARWLGAHNFGIYTYVWVVVNVIGTLATVGLSMSAVRFLNEYFVHGHHDLARGFLRFGRLTAMLVGLAVTWVGIFTIHAVPQAFGREFAEPLSIGLLSLPAFALTDFHDGTGRARSWFPLAFLPPFVLRPLLLLAFVGFAVFGFGHRGATAAAWALVVATWVTAGVQFFLQERRFRDELKGAAAVMKRLEWLKVSLPLLLLDSFTLLMTNLDILLLKQFVAPASLAIYFAAGRVISFIAFIHFAISAVAMPRFAQAFARRDIASARRELTRFRLWTFVPSVLVAGALLALGPFILAMFGREFPAAWPVMAILALGHLGRALAGPAEAMLAVSGRHVYSAVISGSTAALNVALNLLLIPVYGLAGAAWATACSFGYQSAILWFAANRLARQGYGDSPDASAT